MGGVSATKFLHGATIPGKGDIVEDCLKDLAELAKENDDDDLLDSEKDGTDHCPKIPKMSSSKPQARKTIPPSSAHYSTAPCSAMTTRMTPLR